MKKNTKQTELSGADYEHSVTNHFTFRLNSIICNFRVSHYLESCTCSMLLLCFVRHRHSRRLLLLFVVVFRLIPISVSHPRLCAEDQRQCDEGTTAATATTTLPRHKSSKQTPRLCNYYFPTFVSVSEYHVQCEMGLKI